MLVIRLARHGRRNHPTYRIVLQEKDWAPTSKVLEILGNMDPHTDPRTIHLKTDRVKYWLSQGAKPSNTMHNMLVDAGLVQGPKMRVMFGKKAETEAAPASSVAPTPTEATADATATAAA